MLACQETQYVPSGMVPPLYNFLLCILWSVPTISWVHHWVGKGQGQGRGQHAVFDAPGDTGQS